MGLYNRDYYRDDTPSDWSFSTAPVVKYLIIANIVVFLLQIVILRPPTLSPREAANRLKSIEDEPDNKRLLYETIQASQKVSVVQEWLQLDTEKATSGGQVWRLLTYAFCHDRYSIWHIFINMLLLYWFGRTLETMYTSFEFLLFSLTAAILAGVAFVCLQLYTGSPNPSIGASGMVMAVMMVYTVHFPYEEILVFYVIPVQMRWIMALYVIWDLHPLLLTLAGDEMNTGVAHSAHLGGALFGFLYAWYGWRLAPIVDRLPSLKGTFGRRRPRLRIAHNTSPTSPRDTATLDQILEKISRSGRESLTEDENEILRAASEHLKIRTRGGSSLP